MPNSLTKLEICWGERLVVRVSSKDDMDLAVYGRAVWHHASGIAAEHGGKEMQEPVVLVTSGCASCGTDVHLTDESADCNGCARETFAECAGVLPVHEDWLSVAAALSPHDDVVIEMWEYGSSGCAWGWCLACKTWCHDAWHLSEESHASNVDWFLSTKDEFSDSLCQPCETGVSSVSRDVCVHSSWWSQDVLLSAADRAFLEMREFQDSGYLWGHCTACDCWIDECVSTDEHRQRVGASDVEHHTLRHGNVTEFRPRLWKQGDPLHGAYLIDSFH